MHDSLKRVLVFILAGVFFSFPFLSPASGLNVVPNLQIGYLNYLKASEDHNRLSGSDDTKMRRPSGKKLHNLQSTSKSGVHFSNSNKSNKERLWQIGFAADKVLFGRGLSSALIIHSYFKQANLRSHRTVVLRV
jgi:hypothetical protein